MAADPHLQHVFDLLDNDSPVDVVEIASTLEAAARAGDAKAALLTAYGAGAGYGRSLDWAAAMDWLVVAAERGEASAREQVALLSGEQAPDGDWRELGARIDVAAWTAARPTKIVVEQPRIGIAEGFLDHRLCARLIERARPLLEASLVYDPKSGRPIRDDVRTNTVVSFSLPKLDMPTLLIRQRIANTIGAEVANFERTSVFRYLVGQTFSSHADYISPAFTQEIRLRGQRPLTFLVYLNDAFEGGETHFMSIGQKFRGGVGDAIFFRNVDDAGAPDKATQHAGEPPTRGEKWLLSQFIRDKPQLPG